MSVDDLPLWAQKPKPPRKPTPLVLPAPSAPGSETSRKQARANDRSGKTARNTRRVLCWFAKQTEPRTRHDCAAVVFADKGFAAIAAVCRPVNELVVVRGWLEVVGVEHNRELLRVTEAGRREARAIEQAGLAA